MEPVKIGLLGLGTVGGGTVTVLTRNAREIERRAGRGSRSPALPPGSTGPSRSSGSGRSVRSATTPSRWWRTHRSRSSWS